MLRNYRCTQFRKNSLRLPSHDYSTNGLYFVTMCTANREMFFGDIIDGKVVLSDLGQIANICWSTIPNHYPNVYLDEYVIMPNHIHGIIIIDNRAGIKTTTLSTVVGSFKAGCTRISNKIQDRQFFGWQKGFHDRIILDDISLNKAREYIQLNPERWSRDKNNPINLYIENE